MAKTGERTDADRLVAEGRAARDRVGFGDLATFRTVDRDPVALLAEQEVDRLPELVPVRHARMSASPFAFYRGAARLMAHDLAHQRDTGRQMVICGDAHLSNFGLFASPERQLVFDLNDFDEAAPGPWEWDLRRLATSVVLAARGNGFSRSDARRLACQAGRSYRLAVHALAGLQALDVYYELVTAERIADQLRRGSLKAFTKVTDKARSRTSRDAVAKLTRVDGSGTLRFRSEPPELKPLDGEVREQLVTLYDDYRSSVRPDIALLLGEFRLVDVARRAVGVGSVGTRCFVLLLIDATEAPLVLQIKEADRSVVAEYCTADATAPRIVDEAAPHGRRVVAHQQILQAVSDPFLGCASGAGQDFYFRQLRDMKGGIDIDRLTPRRLEEYTTACAMLLARAHAQGGDAPWLAGYTGRSGRFDQAVADWASAYAVEVDRDHRRYVEAVGHGGAS